MRGVVRSPIFDDRRTEGRLWTQIARHVRSGGRLAASLGPAAFLGALLLVAVIAALVGGLLARHLLVAQPPLTAVIAAGHLTEAAGLLLRIDSIAWERDGSAAKPAHAMLVDGKPGRCLQVRISLQNLTDRSQVVTVQEFRLLARTGTTWSPAEDSVPVTTLGPSEAQSTVLVFDVPAMETGFQLVWTRDRQELRMPLGTESPARRGWRSSDNAHQPQRMQSTQRNPPVFPGPQE